MLEITRKFPGPSDLSWKSNTSAIKEQTDGREKTEQLKPFQEVTGGKSFPSVSEQYKDIKSDIENPFKSLKKDKNLDALVGDFIDSNKPHEGSSISGKPQKPSSDVTTQQAPLPDISTTGPPDEVEKPPAGAANITGQTGTEPSAGEGSAPQAQVSQRSAPSEPGTGRQQENSQRITGTEEKPPETSSAAIRRPAGMAQRAGRTEQTQGGKPPGTSSAGTSGQAAGSGVPDTPSTGTTGQQGEHPASATPAQERQTPATVTPSEQRAPATATPSEQRAPATATPSEQRAPATVTPSEQRAPATAAPSEQRAPAPERSSVETASQDFSTEGTGSQISTPERTSNTSDVTTTSSATRSRVTETEIQGSAEANRQRDRSAWTSVGPVQLSTTLSTRQEAAASGRGSLPTDSSPGTLTGDGSAGVSAEHRVAAHYGGTTVSQTTYIRDGVSAGGQANLDPQRIRSGESPIDLQRAQAEGRFRVGQERRVDLSGGGFFRIRREYDQGAGADIENSRTSTSQGNNWNSSRRESVQGSIDAGLSQTVEGRNSSGSGLSLSLRGSAGVGEGGAFERGISRDERGIHLQVGGAVPIKTPFGADGRLRVDISQQDIDRARAVADNAGTVIEGVHTGVANGVHRASEIAGDVRDDINRGARRVGHNIEAARDSVGDWIRGDDQ